RNTPCLVLGFAIGRVNPEDQGELTDLTSWDQGISASGQAKLARGTWVLKFNASAHRDAGSPIVTPDGLVVGIQLMADPVDRESNLAIHVFHIKHFLKATIRDIVLPRGPLSRTEALRLERMRRKQALQLLDERNRKHREDMKRFEQQGQTRPLSAIDLFNGLRPNGSVPLKSIRSGA